MKADMIISGKHVFTGLDDGPIEASIAIISNRIAAIGSKEELQSMIGDETIVKEYHDELILPGFHDFHMHIMQGSILQNNSVNLFEATSEEEAAKLVYDFAASRPDDEWIFGVGWDHNNWENKQLPHRLSLDELIPERPVLLFNAEVHYAWVNSKAIEVAKLTRHTPDPSYGTIDKDENGELTGLLFEHAMGFVTKYALDFPTSKREALFKTFLKETAKYGITSGNDLFGSTITTNILDDIKTFKSFEERGELTTRIYFSPQLTQDSSLNQEIKATYHSDKVSFSGLKEFIDGVVTGHTAFLLDHYFDQPNTRGSSTQPEKLIKEMVIKNDQEGFQIRFHAIGNAAIRLALDCFEEAQKVNGKRDSRHVIEHVEVLHPDDIKRFHELGVIASFQPKHIGLMEQKAYTNCIGEDQQPQYFPIKTLEETGAVIAYGTDFPVVGLNPMEGIYHALTREDFAGDPWNPAESVTLSQALKAYTYATAYGSFRENECGTLEVGKWADIAILDRNLFDIPVQEIKDVKVKLTIMDGKIVFDSVHDRSEYVEYK